MLGLLIGETEVEEVSVVEDSEAEGDLILDEASMVGPEVHLVQKTDRRRSLAGNRKFPGR